MEVDIKKLFQRWIDNQNSIYNLKTELAGIGNPEQYKPVAMGPVHAHDIEQYFRKIDQISNLQKSLDIKLKLKQCYWLN